MRVTDISTILDLPTDTLFPFDSAELTPQAAESLGRAAEMVRASGPGKITVAGHTDAKGDEAYNLDLSRRRAQAVAAWFGSQVGVRKREFVVMGRGEAEPIAPNAKPDGSDDPSGRAANRRVEVIIPRG